MNKSLQRYVFSVNLPNFAAANFAAAKFRLYTFSSLFYCPFGSAAWCVQELTRYRNLFLCP